MAAGPPRAWSSEPGAWSLEPARADLQAAQGHVPGILPEQPGGGQNSHTAAAATSGV